MDQVEEEIIKKACSVGLACFLMAGGVAVVMVVGGDEIVWRVVVQGYCLGVDISRGVWSGLTSS